MTVRSLLFLRNWIDENIANHPFIDQAGEDAPSRLARRLVEEAEAECILVEEIEQEAGDLREFIKEALKRHRSE